LLTPRRGSRRKDDEQSNGALHLADYACSGTAR
jgi:hypothetical protein